MASPQTLALDRAAINAWCRDTGFTPLPRRWKHVEHPSLSLPPQSTSERGKGKGEGKGEGEGEGQGQDQNQDQGAATAGGSAGASEAATFMMFNMLAGSLAGPTTNYGGFDNADPEILRWDVRGRRLLKCIYEGAGGGLADVVMLCELDHGHYHDLMAPALDTMGYAGVFLSKNQKTKRDGSAVFYNTSRYTLVGYRDVVYTVATPKRPALGQVGLIVTLRDELHPTHPVVTVATTHLKAKPGSANEIQRLDAIVQLLRALDAARICHASNVCVLGGDFNTEPESPVVQAVTACSNLRWAHADAALRPLFTTRKSRNNNVKSHIIDYLFTHGGTVDAVTGWDESDGPPPLLPNSHFPSDHLNIALRMRY